jgi:tetratricopeptide (TPR) repeat protein
MAPIGDSSASTVASPQPATGRKPFPIPWANLRWAIPFILGLGLWLAGVPVPLAVGLGLLVIPLLLTQRKLVLVILVPTVALLLAAFPARNSDAWFHLATGKLLAQGDFRFGVDPFAYTTAGVNWVNHSWLSDWLGYWVYNLCGGMGLVLLKALLIAAVGALLLALGWTKDSPGIPAVCALLALLALAQGIPLNPICVSCLFLALTLWLLERAGRSSSVPAAKPFLRYVPLLVLCVLWVNLDAWFILGPLTIALYLTSEALQPGRSPVMNQGQPRPTPLGHGTPLLGLVLGGSLLACLLNPYHVRAFQLPPPLSFLTFPGEFRSDPIQSPIYFQSPFGPGQLIAFGSTTPGLAYFILAGLSLLSFWLNRGRLSLRWALLWVVFFGLSAFHTRLIPFFAIVAGPCLARNLQELLAERSAKPAWREQGAVLLGVVLLALAWPGWLQMQPFERRSLELVSDPSLERAARQVQSWYEQGLLSDDRHTFNFNAETAHYLAWFGAAHSSRDKEFMDARIQLFPAEAVRDFLHIRQGLSRLGSPPTTNNRDWRALLRKWKIDRIVLSDGEKANLPQLLLPLLQGPEWALLGIEGRTALLGWRDPDRQAPKDSEPWANLVVVEERQGFHPTPPKQAPASGPPHLPRPNSWADPFLLSRPARSADRDEALFHLVHFDAYQQTYAGLNQRIVEASVCAALIGGSTPTGTTLGFSLNVFLGVAALPPGPTADPASMPLPLAAWKAGTRSGLAFQLDDGPVGLLWQGVRAARRGIKGNPEDPEAWMLLGEHYGRLLTRTRERYLSKRFNQLNQLRYTQAVTAFHQALKIQPDLPEAHWSLALLYRHRGWEDLSLKHQKEYLRLTRASGPAHGESEQAFSAHITGLQNSLQQREEMLQQVEAKVRASIANMRVIDQASTAFQARLGGLALKILLESDLGTFGPDGMALELELLLQTGRAGSVQEWSEKEQIYEIGADSYYWFQTLAHASLGDYQQAEDDLLELAAPQVLPGFSVPFTGQNTAAMLLAQALLREVPMAGLRFVRSAPEHVGESMRVLRVLSHLTDMAVVRGLLAMEVGRSEDAEKVLRDALLLWSGDPGPDQTGSLFDFFARPVAQDYVKRLQAGKPPGR